MNFSVRIADKLQRYSLWNSSVLLIVLMLMFAPLVRAAVETPDSEALRDRARQEAQARERQQHLPRVDLQPSVPPAAQDPLAIAESPCFTIRDFVLDVPAQLSSAAHRAGASTLPHDPFRFAQDFIEQYAGRCIGREGISRIVQGVTAQILARGYSTTRIVIPEQDISSGTLKLTLIPGMIHALRFADPSTQGTWRNAFPTAAGKLLNLRDLEQGLEQMKRVSSQDVEMQILPAGQTGESDIVMTVRRGQSWRMVATLDDSGATGTGKAQAGVQFGWDNVLGINDVLTLAGNTDAERNNAMRGTQGNSLSYSLPYGYWTATLAASDSDYHQRIMGAVQSFMSSGRTQNLETKISYLFHRDQFSTSSVQFRTGKRWSHAYIDDTEIAVQKRNTTLAEIALIHKHNIGSAQLNSTFAYRWGAPWFGAQVDPANVSGNSPRYRYALETLEVSLSLPFLLRERGLTYSATFRAQNSNTALYASEWFAIGNRWTVRGFDGETALGAEKGFFLRNEIALPLIHTEHTLYAGIDCGAVYGANVVNLLGNKLVGAVIGLRGGLGRSASYDMFAGSALYKPPGLRSDTPAIGLSLSYQM